MQARKWPIEGPSAIAPVSWETLSTPCPSLSANRLYLSGHAREPAVFGISHRPEKPHQGGLCRSERRHAPCLQAADGAEIFAFIPGPIFPKLTGAGVASKDLTSPSYTHQFFVDGLPTMGDVFFNNAWHTVLVGGLNQGDKAYTRSTSLLRRALTESNAASLVLWEFTDTNDADLGYTFTQPSIVRLHNSQWAAVFGNGYNNAQSDGRASTTGYAVLYIVNIETGSVIRKISTQAGSALTPNGLATPAVVDLDGDVIADYVFAGDLLGNMWKFDIRDPNPANWHVAYTDGSSKPAPLYVATDSATPTPNRQPITDRPEVGRGPERWA